MFWKQPTCQHAPFGVLSWSRPQWRSGTVPTSAGDALLSFDGDSSGPSSAGLVLARAVLDEADRFVAIAKAFLQEQTHAREFMGGHGDLVLDGFSFRSTPNRFEVDLALSQWPDAMISVVFKDGLPCDVVLAD